MEQDPTDDTGSSYVVDLRSDTVTKPTRMMRNAMANAVVGDDGRGEDLTVKELENYAKTLFDKEEGLFVPSGTMGNLISVLCHCKERDSEAIVGDLSHLCIYEQGGISTLGGVHSRQLRNREDGTIDLVDIENAIRTDDPHHPVTRLICLENTHNHCGGRVLSLQYLKKVGLLARKYGIPVHIDGARIMNAAAALQVKPSKLTEYADSVSVCLSKGLGAPVGSLILGRRSFIAQARRLRKALGGQLRQAGVLAAPGLLALKKMPSKLKQDHELAKYLATNLNQIQGLRVDVSAVESNMLIVDVSQVCQNTDEFVNNLESNNVLCCKLFEGKLRLVTHHQLSFDAAATAIEAFQEVVSQFMSDTEDEMSDQMRKTTHLARSKSHEGLADEHYENTEYRPERNPSTPRAPHPSGNPEYNPEEEYDPEVGSAAKRSKTEYSSVVF